MLWWDPCLLRLDIRCAGCANHVYGTLLSSSISRILHVFEPDTYVIFHHWHRSFLQPFNELQACCCACNVDGAGMPSLGRADVWQFHLACYARSMSYYFLVFPYLCMRVWLSSIALTLYYLCSVPTTHIYQILCCLISVMCSARFMDVSMWPFVTHMSYLTCEV